MKNEEATDYPAAHSMDTTWFGVDEAGEIASFETGENGTIPASAGYPADTITESWYDLYYSLPKNESGAIELPIDDEHLKHFCSPRDLEKNFHELLKGGYREDLLVRYSDSKDILSDILYENDIPAPPLLYSGQANIVLHPFDPDISKIEKLVNEGKIIAIAPENAAGYNQIQSKADALGITTQQATKLLTERYSSYLSLQDLQNGDTYWSRHFSGLHFYSSDEYFGFYEADIRPADPINISDFPNRDHLEKTLFKFNGVRFSDISILQPFAFDDCVTYGASKLWLGVDGSYHRNSKYKAGTLLGDNKVPLTQQEVLKAGAYKTGYLPPDFDQEEWYNWAYSDESSSATTKGQSILSWFGFGKK